MPRLSVEFSLGLLATLLLYLLDKSGKNSGLITASLLILATALCLHPVLSMGWVWSPTSVALKAWRASFVTSTVLLTFSYFAIWIWPPGRAMAATEAQPQPALPTQEATAPAASPTSSAAPAATTGQENGKKPMKSKGRGAGKDLVNPPGATINQTTNAPYSANVLGNNNQISISAVPPQPPERTLANEKFAVLVRELTVSTAPKVSITIVPDENDNEPSKFGNQVISAFRQAGWQTETTSTQQLAMTIMRDDGVSVFKGSGFNCGAPDASAPEVQAALNAFKSVGLECAWRDFLSGRRRDAALVIVIGKRI